MKRRLRTAAAWLAYVVPFLAPALPPAAHAAAVAGERIAQVKHNNPGLLVDLGVGLWAWPLPMDFDEDGLMDLVVACTDRPSNGIYVFRNTGEVDPVTLLPVFAPGGSIGRAGEGAWGRGPSPSISYVNGRPMVTTSGNLHPEFRTRGFEQPVELGDPTKIHIGEGRVRANQWKIVDFDGDGVQDVAVGIGYWGDYGWDDAFDAEGRWTRGPLRGYVYLLRNLGSDAQPRYSPPEKLLTTDGRPVDVFGMPSPNFGDFDGDGDLDLLCGEFVDGFTYFENVGTRREARYAPGRPLAVAGRRLTMELCMIVPVACDFDRDGDLDLVVGDEDGRVAFIESTGKVVEGMPQFLPPRYFRQHADSVKFGALAAPVSYDWDGDGLEDLIVGNTAGYIGFIRNLGGDPLRWAAPVYLAAGTGVSREMAGPNGSIQGPAEAKWGYTNPSVGDWDGDGLADVMTNGIWGRVTFFRNIGTRTAPRLAEGKPVEVAWPGATPKPEWVWWKPVGRELVTQWRTTPAMIDWNRDGLMDLVMLDHEGYLALFERRRTAAGQLEVRPPQRVFWGEGVSAYDGGGRPTNQISGLLRMNERRAGGSGRRTFTFHDWDGDGELDLLVNSSTNVNVLRGLGRDAEGRWRFRDAGSVHTHLLASHSTTPTIARWPGRKQPLLVIGAEDGFLYSLPLDR
jgi:hypothetical protein